MVSHKDILSIVQVLKKTTRIVKLYPFVVTIAYAITTFGYIFCDDDTAIFLYQVLYTSPLIVSFNIMLSRSLKLCKWHRLQCYLPMLPLVPVMIDYYICPLSRLVSTINAIVIVILYIASLINAYFVFVKPKQ